MTSTPGQEIQVRARVRLQHVLDVELLVAAFDRTSPAAAITVRRCSNSCCETSRCTRLASTSSSTKSPSRTKAKFPPTVGFRTDVEYYRAVRGAAHTRI